MMGMGVTTVSTTSCEDMLTPDMDRYTEGFCGKDTVYFYNGILRNVQDMVEQNELLADLRSDLVATTDYSSDSVADIINYKRQIDGDNALLNRAAYYKVINQCNFYLAKVDTMAIKNGIYYMRKEYAQVVNIRAWSYLQLVQTYGRVPFVTAPVDNADTGWETNPPAWADASNLVALLHKDLEQAQLYERLYGYPNYGDISTGAISVPTKKIRFYANLVLGDLYLLRGQDRSDYVKAAECYHKFLSDQAEFNNLHVDFFNAAAYNKSQDSNTGVITYLPQIAARIGGGLGATDAIHTDNLTVIPSAANNNIGRMLSRTSEIYGFVPHSTTFGSGSATVLVSTQWRSRQVQPSNAYLRLNAAQLYKAVVPGNSGGKKEVEYYESVGDARKFATIATIEQEEGRGDYIMKYAPVMSVLSNGEIHGSPNFKHYRTLYRLNQVYLRYAEAINRAGYPRLAFMVLRDGINDEKMPELKDSLRVDAETGKTHRVYYLDSAAVESATNYIGVNELRRMKADPQFATFLDYKKFKNDGIHELGCGASTIYDDKYTYENVVAQRIKDEAKIAGLESAPEVQQAIRKLRAGVRADVVEDEETPQGPQPDPENVVEPQIEPADPLEINAVESLIADECALEMAYEGTRMSDLIRFARHRNVAGTAGVLNGTSWLAWKIARRNVDKAPFEDVKDYDAALYGLLLNEANWYVKSPEYGK